MMTSTKPRHFLFGTTFLLVSAVSTPAAPQSTPELKPLPIDAVLLTRTFGEYTVMDFSPDGRWLAYTLRERRPEKADISYTAEHMRRSGLPWWGVDSDVWIVNTETREARNLTEGKGNNWSPAWSPDGRYLAFLSDRAPEGEPRLARLWVWEARTGHERQVSPENVRSRRHLMWSKDGRRVLVQLLPEGADPEAYAAEAETSREKEEKVLGSTVTIYRGEKREADEPVEGGWSLHRTPVDLAWVEVRDGTVDGIVRHASISRVLLAPDGQSIAYTTPKRFEKAGSQQVLFDLVVISEGRSRIVASDIRLNYGGDQFAWSPAGARLAYRTWGMEASRDVYVVALDGSEPRKITPEPHPNFDSSAFPNPFWDSSGEHVYFIDGSSLWKASISGAEPKELAKLEGGLALQPILQAENLLWTSDEGRSTILVTRGVKTGKAGFHKIDLGSGTVTALLEEDKYYGGYDQAIGFAVSDDGRRLVYASQDARHSPDLYLLREDHRGGERLTTVNPEFDQYVMGERRIIEWRSLDGDTTQGVLLLPAGYESGKRYPMITKVYGGSTPTRSSANRFGLQGPPVDNLQLLATRGYAVFLPNLPLNEGTVMMDLVKVVLPGVDKAVEMGIADPDRLGLTGHSFGGYNTIALISQTTRFRAAMMSAGLANVLGLYGEMAADGTAYGLIVIEGGQFLIHGNPWEQRTRYLENSPIYYLDRVETPLMIVHGGKDVAVAPFLADEIFVGLRRLGKEVVYAKYAGEEHHQSQWSHANQLDYWRRVISWFDDHLKDPDENCACPGGPDRD